MLNEQNNSFKKFILKCWDWFVLDKPKAFITKMLVKFDVLFYALSF